MWLWNFSGCFGRKEDLKVIIAALKNACQLSNQVLATNAQSHFQPLCIALCSFFFYVNDVDDADGKHDKIKLAKSTNFFSFSLSLLSFLPPNSFRSALGLSLISAKM